MKKLFLRLLGLTCLALLLAGAWGYHKGLRSADVQQYVSGLFAGNPDLEPDSSGVKPVTHKKPGKKGRISPPNDPSTALNEQQPLPKNPFAKIDAHARNCPESAMGDLESLATYLQEGASTDLEKARAIYVWLATFIRYDDDGYNTDNPGPTGAKEVLETRKSVCDGYSNLFLALGERMGLPVKKVLGYAKGYGDTPNMKFKDTDHAWNLINIDGRRRIFDATWGAGISSTVRGKLVSTQKFDDFWFNVDPQTAIFSHLPEQPELGNINPALTLSQFESLPRIEDDFFRFGFDARKTYQQLMADHKSVLPQAYPTSTYIKMLKMPEKGVLTLRQAYDFECYIPQAFVVVLVNEQNEWTYFEGHKGLFKLHYTPDQQGSIQLVVRYRKGADDFETFLEYAVR